MSALAPTVEAFFTQRLIVQRDASPATIAAYRDALRLLLVFVFNRTGKTPAHLDFADLDAAVIGAFLTHLETDRGNSVATRNARLAAIRSLFGYAALRHPEHADVIQRVLAIPTKRGDQPDVCYLTPAEIDALLAAPDRATWNGRRDHALLLLDIQTGLRISELDAVTVLLPDPTSRLLTRELLYTAITRAQRQLTLIATDPAIRTAVTSPIARASGLGDQLWPSTAW